MQDTRAQPDSAADPDKSGTTGRIPKQQMATKLRRETIKATNSLFNVV